MDLNNVMKLQLQFSTCPNRPLWVPLRRFETPIRPCGHMILYTRLFIALLAPTDVTPTRICVDFISLTWHFSIIDWCYRAQVFAGHLGVSFHVSGLPTKFLWE